MIYIEFLYFCYLKKKYICIQNSWQIIFSPKFSKKNSNVFAILYKNGWSAKIIFKNIRYSNRTTIVYDVLLWYIKDEF